MSGFGYSAMIPIERSVNRFSTAVPLYVQIAEGLLDRIESGELSPGDRLPSERELSQMLGVNRMTLWRALELLASRRLLIRRQGDGTYVAEPKIKRQAGQLVPFTRGMQRRGCLPGAKMISLEKRPAEAAVAVLLGLPVSEPVYYVRRLRLMNQEPVMLERRAIPARRFPGFGRFAVRVVRSATCWKRNTVSWLCERGRAWNRSPRQGVRRNSSVSSQAMPSCQSDGSAWTGETNLWSLPKICIAVTAFALLPQ